MLGPSAPVAPPRFSASMLPIDADPAERDFVRLLERALAPSFTLVRRLGAGAMGSVYLARDPVLKRLVAVKVMAPALASDQQARARFEREAQTVASISHPNVVAVYSVGTLENGVPFLVMQYVEGKTMAERIAEGGPLEAPTAKRVLGEVASALAAAHRKGVIHRDIKPSNILWDDETGRALVTDFGIAAVKKHGDGSDPTKLTQSGVALGTPAYMSPEQVRGEEVTEKTDVYSLGVLGYELLTSEGPYALATSGEVLAAHLRDTPRKLSGLRADVDPEVERLLEDCLHKEAERRPTAAECQDRITHGASILLEWPPPGLEHLNDKLRRALRPTALGGALIGVPLVLLAAFDRDSYVRDLLPPIEFVLSVAALGFFVFLLGCVRVLGFFRAAGKCVDTGYRWGTVAEAAADWRGDTGALITGAREYATLHPAQRSTLRRNRVLATAFLLVSAVTPVLGFAIGALVAARTPRGPAVVFWSSLAASLVFIGVWAVLSWFEERRLRRARSRRLALSSVQERPAELAASWTESFDQVRMGQRMGAGPAGRRRAVWRSVVAVIVVTLVAALGAEALILASAVNNVMLAGVVPRFNAVREKIRRVERLDAYVVPADSNITAERAGQALYAVGESGPRVRRQQWQAEAKIAIPQFRLPAGDGPFGAVNNLPDAFVAARRGFTDAQRRWLRQLADNPGLAEFRLAANARRLDLGSALYAIPPGSRVGILDFPIPAFMGIRNAAYSNTAAAALDLGAGQPRDAERRLREVISVGFLMMRDGRTLMENLMGATIVDKGRLSLEAFYQATGRAAEARAVSPATDPVLDLAVDPDGRQRVPVEEMARMLRRIALDSTEIRGMRWEMLATYSLMPCADARQILFGPDSVHTSVMDEARASLVRSPSDSIYFSMIEQPMNRRYMVRDGQPLTRVPFTVSGWIATRLTGHNVFASCAALMGLK
jgi:serine/threonine protein kinase